MGLLPKEASWELQGRKDTGHGRRETGKEEEGKGQGMVGHCAGKTLVPT